MNDVSYESPTVPILLQILSGVPVGDLLPAGSIYPLKRDESVELYIPPGGPGGPVSPILIMSLELSLYDAFIASCPSPWPFFLCRSQRREQDLQLR